VTPDERWLAAVWPFVRASLPAAPARVVEIGCGPLGGFVPMLEPTGYLATGVDPEAPPGPSYRQVEFERWDMPGQVDAIVACASLHHVTDLGTVLDLVDAALAPGGVATYRPYFFPELAGISESDEQAAIDGGPIQANRIQYVGRRRSHTPASSA
jgi:SAM-dependent methyltransferase